MNNQNKLDAKADFEYYAKLSLWTIEESIALSFGRNPKVIDSNRLQYSASNTLVTEECQAVIKFLAKYEELKELIQRARACEEIDYQNKPKVFIKWAKSKDIHFPQELVDLVDKYHVSHEVNWEKKYKELEIENKKLMEQLEKKTDLRKLKSYQSVLLQTFGIICGNVKNINGHKIFEILSHALDDTKINNRKVISEFILISQIDIPLPTEKTINKIISEVKLFGQQNCTTKK